MRVGILGASSHIAKGLISELNSRCGLILFARNVAAVKDFLRISCKDSKAEVLDLENLFSVPCDVLINCIGLGTPRTLAAQNHGIFSLTEYFDRQIHEYLISYPYTTVIHMSSGAVYSGTMGTIGDQSQAMIAVNSLSEREYYQIAKLNSEAKHRSLADFAVVDIRVFGYFSPFIDLNSGFLITEIMGAAFAGEVFKTGSDDIVRDFVGSEDMASLVWNIITGARQNAVVDIYSKKPVSKWELIRFFQQAYDLKVAIIPSAQSVSPTGTKPSYYSENRSAFSKFNYVPRYGSMDLIKKTCFEFKPPLLNEDRP